MLNATKGVSGGNASTCPGDAMLLGHQTNIRYSNKNTSRFFVLWLVMWLVIYHDMHVGGRGVGRMVCVVVCWL